MDARQEQWNIYFTYEESNYLHDAFSVFHTLWMKNVETQLCHKQWCAARCDLEDRQPCLGTDILRSDGLFASVRCERKEGSKNIHSINVMLPHLKSPGAKVDSQNSIFGLFVMQVHRDRLGNISQSTEQQLYRQENTEVYTPF